MKALLLVTLATFMVLQAVKAEDNLPKPTVIPGVENLHDLRYLPEWRYSGDPSPWRDYEMKLNLYLPPVTKGQKLPLVMYVHGGAYAAGNKEGQGKLIEMLTKNGFAVASLNYILLNKGIFPQVFWDYEDSARFLRLNAERYHLDPTAFGAIGISAGGWLITTAGNANGENFTKGVNSRIRLNDLRKTQFTVPKGGPGEDSFLRPILATEIAYPGTYGRFQALAFDFSMMNDAANGFTPALLEFVGDGFTPRHAAALTGAGVDWTKAVMTHPKHHGSQVHVPKWFGTENGGEGMTRTLDGKGEAQLADVVIDWFKRELVGAQARTPVPDIWPTTRLVSGPTQVAMLTPDSSINIRYTIDGSNPTADSLKYTQPFTVQPITTVRAFASMPGRRPSRVVEASFIDGPIPPVITAPLARELPPATTGQPYAVQFTANTDTARWSVQGDLRPYFPEKSKTMTYPNGMSMDGNGRWTGTPTTPGVYWVQIWVNDGPGRIASHRNYRWTVSGSP